jgi:superkiller protein 3
MRLHSEPFIGCILCFLLGVSSAAHAQVVNVTRTHIVQDPAGIELQKLLTDAQAAADRKDFQTAAQNYLNYLAKKPDDAITHFNLGYVYTAMQQPTNAKAEYEKAILLDPKMAPAYLNLGLTLLETDPSGAVEPLQKAAALTPNEARPKFILGLAFERSGKLPEAIEQFQVAEKLDTKDFSIRLKLGYILLRVARPADAEQEFRAGIAMQPDSSPAHLGLAESLVAQMKLEGAASELDAYLKTQPNDIDIQIERATVLADLGKDDQALDALDHAAAVRPENLSALKLRARVFFDKKRFADAVVVLQKAAALAPNDPEIPARLGHAYLENKDYAHAVEELIAAFKFDSASNAVLIDLVDAQYLNKNYPAALHNLDELSKREALPAGSWFIRATCYDRLGQIALALEAYQKFLQLNNGKENDMYFEASARARTLTRELQKR